MTEPVKLLAVTNEDLKVLAALVQDAIVKVGEVKFDPSAQTFSLLVSRFMHEAGEKKRIGSVLRFQNVLSAKMRGIHREDPNAYMVLLDIEFVKGETPPSGTVRLIFAGNGEIRLDCDALEVRVFDFTKTRTSKSQPIHPDV